jgi:hypothetical protein
METEGNTENITISKPESWDQADWDALSPLQKARYATNQSLFRPGQSGRDEGRRPPGRPRKDGMPAGSVASTPRPDRFPAAQGGETPVHRPTFEVADASDLKESLEVNGLALVQDAFERAARAASSGDPFDRMVYGILLTKALPMATLKELGKGMSGAAKARKKALEALLAAHDAGSDAEFTPVDGGSDAE